MFHKRLLVLAMLLMPTLASAQVTSVTITNGVPTAGTGTVSTLDAFAASAGASSGKALGVQGVASMVPFLVAQSGVWNVTNISGTISLPTGASTAANQSTAIGLLSTVATNSGSAIPDCGAAPCTNKIGVVYNQTQYPVGAVPITASATGTTGATTATLAAAVAKTTYVCGFSIRANATAATTGNATVTGTITGTLNFLQWTAPLASGIGITEPSLGNCIPGSGTNTGIAVVSAAPGSGGTVTVSAWGFQQ